VFLFARVRKREALVVLLVPGEHPFPLIGKRRVICIALTIELLDRFDLGDLLVDDIPGHQSSGFLGEKPDHLISVLMIVLEYRGNNLTLDGF
jgi:hypothetical protein